jgi:transposase
VKWGICGHFRDAGVGRRQRIHDARRDDHARPPAQRLRPKKDGQDQAIGRSRGGLTTKIHAVTDALGNPVALSLTPGQAADITQAEPLLNEIEPSALIADKGYDCDALIERLEARDIAPVIPSKANRTLLLQPEEIPGNCNAIRQTRQHISGWSSAGERDQMA